MSPVTKPHSEPLALTMGDPAGIGPDITLRSWCERARVDIPAFIYLGDPQTLAQRARQLRLEVPIHEVESPDAAVTHFAKALPVYPLRLGKPVTPGTPCPVSAPAIIDSIDLAVEWVRGGKASALVTNPINKKLLTEAGFDHPGHTEYLAHLCTQPGRKAPHPVMLLTSGELRAVPATVHIPLRDVPGALSEALIIDTVDITAHGLMQFFDIATPRIGVTGLNPHSGEGGTLGREELDIISPAIETLKARGLDVSGPLPADAAFQARLRKSYDVIVAMYHDQALIAVKTLAFDRTVNVTLGLPIVRTSPDHGTAYGLAGTGNANPGSLMESLRVADSMAARELADA